MRLWSLHPSLLDAKGLTALWRESLLAQKVLRGLTKGYRHHPQLLRFRACSDPAAAIATYLREIYRESVRRGYQFDPSKIGGKPRQRRIPVARGQLQFEREHLATKLRVRDQAAFSRLQKMKRLRAHPLFRIVPGGVETWERKWERKKVRP